MHSGGAGPNVIRIDLEGTFRYDGDAVSVRYDEIFQDGEDGSGNIELPPGKAWIELTQTSTNPLVTEKNKAPAARRRQADPAGLLGQLGDAVTLVDSVLDSVGGAPARRYRLRIDWARVAQRETDPVERQSAQRQAERGPTTELWWLVSSNRPLRRVIGPVEGPNPLGLGPAVDITYRNWGEPVPIIPPPADQVAPG
jgi:hypothetical protein